MIGRIRNRLVQIYTSVLLLMLLAPQAASANIFHTKDRKIPDLVVFGTLIGVTGAIILGGVLLWPRLRQAAVDHILVAQFREELRHEQEEAGDAERIARGEAPIGVQALRGDSDYNDEEEEHRATSRRLLIAYTVLVGIAAVAVGCYLTYSQVLV